MDIDEPIDFFQFKKDVKIVDKAVKQTPNNGYWIIPLMVITTAVLYYYNPQINISDTINPVIERIENYIPKEYATIFVTGTFIYKFITISISNITGYDLNIFSDDDDKGFNSTYKKDLKYLLNKRKNFDPVNDLTSDVKEEYERYFPDNLDNLTSEEINKIFPENQETPKASTSKLPETISNKNTLPMIENPFKKTFNYHKNDIDSKKVKIEDWN